MTTKSLRLSDRDLDFLAETAGPEVGDKYRLRQILKSDSDFRNSYIEDPSVFQRVMDDDEIFIKISPTLLFEILLRRTAHEFKALRYTVEKTTFMRIPIFDTDDVVKLLSQEAMLTYLSDMLSSFTRIESYAISFRTGKGIWRKIRFNDLDVHSLMSFCRIVEDPVRFRFYKRIADICLFILGVFPEYAEYDYRYPFSGQVRPHLRDKLRISPEDYEQYGKKFFKMAAQHQSSEELAMTDVLWNLHENFQKAKKPLNFISDHYMRHKRHHWFG